MTEALVAQADREEVLAKGGLSFTVEARIIRELGERLVRQPEVAILELIKNAHDADARECRIENSANRIVVRDDGTGMTFDDFAQGWMRIGTSDKSKRSGSRRYHRAITGEKGIGRFAVRHLGAGLLLDTTAFDEARGMKTRLRAAFRWKSFDGQASIEDAEVKYRLTVAEHGTPTGTVLTITGLKEAALEIDWKVVRTGSIGVVSAVRSLLKSEISPSNNDPGFTLYCSSGEDEPDVASQILDRYALRALINLQDGRLTLEIFQAAKSDPYLRIDDDYNSDIGDVYADIRFLPRREGAFKNTEIIRGHEAYAWVRDNAGVKVFDRSFQVSPYGMKGDDWLSLTGDAARNLREPTSTVMNTHLPMDPAVKASTKLNWMLRLPEDKQLIGVVQVNGRREKEGQDRGLVAAADREGFVNNEAFRELQNLIRGAVEAIAYSDREIALEAERKKAAEALKLARETTRKAISEIERDRELTHSQRDRIVQVLEASQDRFEREQTGSKEREHQLEVMSLLGVVAGFMTHEFGAALSELRAAKADLEELAKTNPQFSDHAAAFDKRIEALRGFVRYSRAYVEGAKTAAVKPFPARPRFTYVIRAFGPYAEKRRINVEIDVEDDVMAPLIPPSLYDGIAQNLFTNALKALTASSRNDDRRIVIRAWNDPKHHRMQVSDTGVGIPSAIQNLVFDPLFTTTDKRNPDPLGSGMGLGLALVRRGAAAFGGTADLVTPPPGFTTCVEVKFPREVAA